MLDHRFRFVVVGSAQIDDVVAPARNFAQKRRARERCHVGHAGGGGNGRCGKGRWRSNGADQREYALVLDQAAGVGNGPLRFVGVVQRLQFELATVDAAAAIGFAKRRLDAKAHVYAQFLGRAGERRRLAEDDGFGNANGPLGLFFRGYFRGYLRTGHCRCQR